MTELPLQADDDVEARVMALFAPGAGTAHESFAAALDRATARGAVGGKKSELLAALDALPAQTSVEEYLAFVARDLAGAAANVASPRSLAHMSAVTVPMFRLLSDAVLALNQNLVKESASPAATAVEERTIAALRRLVYGASVRNRGFPSGLAVSGATAANIAALWCARDAAFPRTRREGLAAALLDANCRGAAIVGSELMHYSFDKAAAVLGLGMDGVVRVPVDRRGRVDPLAVRDTVDRLMRSGIRVIAIVGIAGTTDCGSFDPLAELAAIARSFGIHFHVDAAWGGAFLFSHSLRQHLHGIEEADSVTLDAHKQFFAPVGSGFLLLRDPRLLQAVEQSAAYLFHPGARDLGRFAIDGSRAAHTLFLHAALHVIGADGFAFLGEESVRKASEFAALIEATPGCELLATPETNIVLYRIVAPSPASDAELNERNIAVQRIQAERGNALVSRTTVSHLPGHAGKEIVALRAILANPRTTIDDLRFILNEQLAIARRE